MSELLKSLWDFEPAIDDNTFKVMRSNISVAVRNMGNFTFCKLYTKAWQDNFIKHYEICQDFIKSEILNFGLFYLIQVNTESYPKYICIYIYTCHLFFMSILFFWGNITNNVVQVRNYLRFRSGNNFLCFFKKELLCLFQIGEYVLFISGKNATFKLVNDVWFKSGVIIL